MINSSTYMSSHLQAITELIYKFYIKNWSVLNGPPSVGEVLLKSDSVCSGMSIIIIKQQN